MIVVSDRTFEIVIVAFYVLVPLIAAIALAALVARRRRRVPPPTIDERARRAQQSAQARTQAEAQQRLHQADASWRRDGNINRGPF